MIIKEMTDAGIVTAEKCGKGVCIPTLGIYLPHSNKSKYHCKFWSEMVAIDEAGREHLLDSNGEVLFKNRKVTGKLNKCLKTWYSFESVAGDYDYQLATTYNKIA